MTNLTLPERICIIGDVHGDMGFFDRAISYGGNRLGVDTFVQVGDFWLYEENFTSALDTAREEVLAQNNARLFFLDGNHEEFSVLGERIHQPGSHQVGERTFYMGRGTSGTMGNKHFLALGGAVSIDQERRIEGVSWFPDENLTQEDVDNALSAPQADVMFTHDIPHVARSPFTEDRQFSIEVEEQKRLFDERMTEVFMHHKPKVLVHGHYHVPYTSERGGFDFSTIVKGLDMNRQSRVDESVMLLSA